MSFALRNASRAAPAVARGARSYATPASLFSVADAAGVKVASSDEGATTGAISVVVKAGSRYESAPGLAHVLKHQVFKVSRPTALLSPSPFASARHGRTHWLGELLGYRRSAQASVHEAHICLSICREPARGARFA